MVLQCDGFCNVQLRYISRQFSSFAGSRGILSHFLLQLHINPPKKNYFRDA